VTANPLVAGPADPTTALSGTGLLESVTSTAQAIENKDWVGAALAGFATAMDTVVAALDPLGTLIAWGAGWLIDHLEPLKGWLNDLTGDAGAVAGFAQTWVNVAGQMEKEASFLTKRVTAELEGIKGEAAAAYREYAAHLAGYVGGMKKAASAVAGGLQVASTIVQVVDELVRDTLAQIIGSLSSAILQAVVSLGTLIPKVIADVSARVAALAGRIGKTVKAVVEALGKLRNLVKKLGEAMEKIRSLLRRGGDGPPGGGGGGRGAGGRNPVDSWSPDAVRNLVSASPAELRRAARTAEDHLAQLDPSPANDAMLARIRRAAAEGRPLHESELNFLRHELTEARLMNDGADYPTAHDTAGQQHPRFANYHPDVIDQHPEMFNNHWRNHWGLGPR
jgi:hypothetical protein